MNRILATLLYAWIACGLVIIIYYVGFDTWCTSKGGISILDSIGVHGCHPPFNASYYTEYNTTNSTVYVGNMGVIIINQGNI